MASAFDDERWERVSPEAGPPPPAQAAFVASLGPAGDALDLGCGDGRLAAALRCERLTLADVSAVALARARERHPGSDVVELEPDGPLPLGDNVFDLVLCAETLEHVRDTQLLLSEARRVLRPGGKLAVTTPARTRAFGVAIALRGVSRTLDPRDPHLRHLDRRSLTGLLDDTGFDVRSLRRRAGTLMAEATR